MFSGYFIYELVLHHISYQLCYGLGSTELHVSLDVLIGYARACSSPFVG